jgi:hypothetical protein
VKKTAIRSSIAVALCIIGVWCWYALNVPDQTLADQGRCSQSVRVKAIDATRYLFGHKTSSEIDADNLKQYSNPLQAPPKFACPD